jgi:hypothetical protein
MAGDPGKNEQKTAKKNTQNVDSLPRPVVKKGSQDVSSEGLDSSWVFSELGCFDVALHQATQNAETNNGDSFSIISNGILLPPVPSQAQILGNPLPSSLVGCGNAVEIDLCIENFSPTNYPVHKTNSLSLRTPSRDVTKLDGDKNWLKAHEMSLLECGFQFVGSHTPEERFSRDEIIDELISTFPCPG